MADERYEWLNRSTAERLLRGEPLEAVDASGRDQAEPLSRVLGALSAEASRAPGELPGEQAALAAFRKVREAAEAERATTARADGAPGRRAGAPVHDGEVGLVRIAGPARSGIPARRPRRARPVRLALAAAVVAGTLGGVAVAAGSGVLPAPFGDEHPGPAASVTAGTSAQPLDSASPPATYGGGPGAPSGSGASTSRGDTSDEAAGPDGGRGPGADTGSGAPSRSPGPGSPAAAKSCRALRDGTELDAGRKRALANLAGGSARVDKFCKVVLAVGGPFSGPTNGGKGDTGKDRDRTHGKGRDRDKGHGTGKGRGDGGEKGDDRGGDEDAHPGRARSEHGRHGGRNRRHGGGDRRHEALPAPSAFAPAARPGHPARHPAPPATPATSPTSAPSPAHTAP
ncbi:hypothetical protein ACGFT2_09070 [Streptomyces sp. NPDC048514]|uniref:hypothetical protein n=1 Tax=Streptomyces sp. NPDC048514 TaxID=3365564 RepID=UPI00371F195A